MINKAGANHIELFDDAPIGIFNSTFDGRFLYVNKAFATILKYESPEEVICSTADIQKQLFTKDFNRQAILAQVKRDGRLVNYEVEYCCKDGSIINALLNIHIKKDKENNELYIEGFINDTTSLITTDVKFIKEAEDQIRRQQKIMESLFKHSPDAIIHIDMNNNIININEKFTELFGYTVDECVGKTVDELIVSEEYIEEGKTLNNIAHENQKIELDTMRKNKDGELINVCIRGGPIFADGQIFGYHAIYTDIRARKEAEAKIKYLSYHDELTGLYNRAFFEEELKRLDTPRQLPLAIIVGDVNGLKLTNDVFGHFKGDELLVKTAEILKRACRKEDIICRWGGDEFAILLSHTDKEVTDGICQRVYALSSESADAPIQISISLGYAIKYGHEPITEVIKEAEERMYRNKLLISKSTRSHIINSLQKSLYERSHETEAHCQRMKDLSIALGKKMNLDNDKLNELGLLALLHDIGKMAIPDAILQKPGKLTTEEWEQMKRHSEIGYRIAETSPELIHISKYILFHHERWDGTGYPRGLKGDEIPILSRIIAVVDVYDVMTNARVYKDPVSHEEALKEIVRYSGSQFDPHVVNKFIELLSS